VDENANGSAPRSSRKTAIAIVIVLVAVIALGAVGYNMLGSSGPAASSTSNAADSTSSEAGIATDADGNDSGRAEGEASLADLNSVVYDEMENAYDLVGIANGKPLVINFWATWCPYCIDEMPDFQSAYDTYGEQVEFAMIDAVDGTRETLDAGSAYIYENGFTFPVYYDIRRNAVEDFGVTGFPATVIFRADGSVAFAQAGRIDPSLLADVLEEVAGQASKGGPQR